MSFFATGNRAIESTDIGVKTSLSTTTLLAEVDVNGTNADWFSGGQVWGVTWIVGAPATGATFLLDHAGSTVVTTGGIINQTVVSLSSGQTGQYFTKHNIQSSGNRFRVRLASSIVSAHAKVIAEPLV